MAEAGHRVCLMILCGLPASGKTSLTRLLSETTTSLEEKTLHLKGFPSFFIIEYDKLLPAHVEKHLIEEQTSTGANVRKSTVWRTFCDVQSMTGAGSPQLSSWNQSPWKQYRADIYQCVDALLWCLKERVLTSVSALQRPENVSHELWGSFQENIEGQRQCLDSATGDICAVIDDNMYYSSMRYRYYQLARKYTLGFCQVYLKCDVVDALARNPGRDLPVQDSVIKTMAMNFEAPDAVNNSWEKLTVTVSLSDTCLPEICRLIHQALETPVQPVDEVDEELLNQSREICSANFLYQSDQILRRLVSQEMAAVKEKKLQKSEMKKFASGLQARRKQILDGLKAGHISVPSSVLGMATDASKDPDSVVYEFIKNLFHCYQDVR